MQHGLTRGEYAVYLLLASIIAACLRGSLIGCGGTGEADDDDNNGVVLRRQGLYNVTSSQANIQDHADSKIAGDVGMVSRRAEGSNRSKGRLVGRARCRQLRAKIQNGFYW